MSRLDSQNVNRLPYFKEKVASLYFFSLTKTVSSIYKPSKQIPNAKMAFIDSSVDITDFTNPKIRTQPTFGKRHYYSNSKKHQNKFIYITLKMTGNYDLA